jgi:hypothetical protein
MDNNDLGAWAAEERRAFDSAFHGFSSRQIPAANGSHTLIIGRSLFSHLPPNTL